MAGIGPATSPLPRECSTTEPQGRKPELKPDTQTDRLERETGIEPASLAWKAKVLPLNYSRKETHRGVCNLREPMPPAFAGKPPILNAHRVSRAWQLGLLVERAGFEPA